MRYVQICIKLRTYANKGPNRTEDKGQLLKQGQYRRFAEFHLVNSHENPNGRVLSSCFRDTAKEGLETRAVDYAITGRSAVTVSIVCK